jgi:hypothetical protein
MTPLWAGLRVGAARGGARAALAASAGGGATRAARERRRAPDYERPRSRARTGTRARNDALGCRPNPRRAPCTTHPAYARVRARTPQRPTSAPAVRWSELPILPCNVPDAFAAQLRGTTALRRPHAWNALAGAPCALAAGGPRAQFQGSQWRCS